ncbi:unnamed protein product [Calicophoron daubneyi]|uniref:CRC domain-containing protein n=1 Tax=Calicophoron daubneyi TaxID=300641 RepID=A0AAV2T659_CALDB
MTDAYIPEKETKCQTNVIPDSNLTAITDSLTSAVEDRIELENSNYLPEANEIKFEAQRRSLENASVPKLCGVLTYATAYRKPCNCAKSHCLKLYCECFARGAACEGCNCSNCMNNSAHEDERHRAIKLTLERNPLAFHPKIGEGDRKHSKGCNCKRSGCLKNYCECYEAKISCSDLCRCQGCRNFDNGCQQRASSQMQPGNGSRQKNSFLSKKSTLFYSQAGNHGGYREDYIKLPHANQAFGHRPDMVSGELPYEYSYGDILIPTGFLSPEVVEATCSCMLAQLEDAKEKSSSPTIQERIVLEEFGRCLEQILESAAKVQPVPVYPGTLHLPPFEVVSNPDFITVLPNTQNSSLQAVTATENEHAGQFSYQCTPMVNPSNMHYPPNAYESVDLDISGYPDQLAGGCSEPIVYNGPADCSQGDTQTIGLETAGRCFSLSQQLQHNCLPERCTSVYDGLGEPVDQCIPLSGVQFAHNSVNRQMGPGTQSRQPQFAPASDVLSENVPPNIGMQSLMAELRSPHASKLGLFNSVLTSNGMNRRPNNECYQLKQEGLLGGRPPDGAENLTENLSAIEEDEEANTATAALLNASDHYEQTQYAMSSEMDLNTMNENGSEMTVCLNQTSDPTRIRVLNPLELSPSSQRRFRTHLQMASDGCSQSTPTQPEDEMRSESEMILKPEVGFYDL